MNNPKFTMDGPDVIEHNGRFYINMGRPGFNTRANNRDGYATRESAARTLRHYSAKPVIHYGSGNADSDNESKRHGGAW
jgi:hypothetical protein